MEERTVDNGGVSPDEISPQRTENVADTHYYDILGVAPNATDETIRKAYYQKALAVHPDKHKDDPDAKKKFQELGQAYECLRDPDSRRRYDTSGQDASPELPGGMDPALIFTMLFGSVAFEGYVGPLQIASLLQDLLEKHSPSFTASNLESAMYKRQVILAGKLRERITPFVNATADDPNGPETWKSTIRKEAAEIVKVSFGAAIMQLIGYVYESRANQYLASSNYSKLGSTVAKLPYQYTKHGETIGAVTSICRSVYTIANTNTEAEEQHIHEQLPLLLDTLWRVCKLDIMTAVRGATKKVVKDRGAEADVRQLRAEALIFIGKTFQEVAMQHLEAQQGEVDEIRAAENRLQEAMINATIYK
eukprot:Filipodium_phascolosomae@DN7937_c0_g1_i1.p1